MMSEGCAEEGRMSCGGCPKYWSCEKTEESRKMLAEIKGFSHDHPGKRYRQDYGKSKRKSAARAKVNR